MDSNTIKVQGTLQLDNGSIQEITHSALNVNDSLKVTSQGEETTLELTSSSGNLIRGNTTNFVVSQQGGITCSSISCPTITEIQNDIQDLENYDYSNDFYYKDEVDNQLLNKVDTTELETNYYKIGRAHV